jgi:glycosyltransferase involved in cell wall biosynthesis
MIATTLQVLDRASEFDVIHSHLEWYSLPLLRATSVPVAATFHGRLDLPWSSTVFAGAPRGMVAISESQASVHPDVPWTVVHNGLTLGDAPFERRRSDALVFVGRVTPEKGIVEAIEIAAKAQRPLRIAAKIGPTPHEQEFNERVFQPALRAAGRDVEFLGELSGADRDELVAGSHALLMPGSWPEPFGLVAIESLACGTPVLAKRVGGLDEIIRDGVDGFFGDDVTELAFLVDRVDELDRAAIRASVIDRFSATRMADGYEAVYAELLGLAADGHDPGDADGGSAASGLVVELQAARSR